MTPGQHGPRLEPDGGVTFRLWAPAAASVEVVTDRALAMEQRPGGWFERRVPEAGPGTRYRFRIDGAALVPDPASAFQPDDVFGPSEVVDHVYPWQADRWRGRPWHETVLIELHVGIFTPEGTFRAALGRLDDLAETGITAIELMPVADFAGRRNWGYDGVLPFAPDSAYGRPDELRALIDGAHRRGLMVFLDVVYNHFGPEGNFLGRYAPSFFASDAATPWGAAIDFTVPEVRDFAVQNALHWLANYRFDGLRLDAVHAIVRPGQPSILADISRAAGELAARTGRRIHLVLEDDDNRAHWLDPDTDPPRGKYRAQWNDDYHHAWHVLLTGETGSYYRDYAERPLDHLARTLAAGFAYQGEASAHRRGRCRGEPSGHLPPTAFVAFLQNHDQIGNRACGERLDALAPTAAIDAALAVTLLAPMPPLLFMGEEWGSRRPFPFFCDFAGELGEAVRAGRRREFADAHRQAAAAGEVLDPLAEATFRAAVLDWEARAKPIHRARIEFVMRLLRARREHVIPLLAKAEGGAAHARVAGTVLVAEWRLGTRLLSLVANLSDRPGECPRIRAATPIWGGLPPPCLPAWSVYWSLGDG